MRKEGIIHYLERAEYRREDNLSAYNYPRVREPLWSSKDSRSSRQLLIVVLNGGWLTNEACLKIRWEIQVHKHVACYLPTSLWRFSAENKLNLWITTTRLFVSTRSSVNCCPSWWTANSECRTDWSEKCLESTSVEFHNLND